ncbi:MAG: DUF1212 domain-containing protein [Sporanaerobacter sp.]|jgi:uncharacterized membrane protein YjjP (DUF1212 family)|uniref:threonine/serine ThrE exporter family protein n=1 Tax=Sporanaerobacter sp. TaxID=2010183 RepID=UPI003A0FF435
MVDNLENEKKETKELLSLAILAGSIMLKNGAETYRVEDTVNRICKSRKKTKYVESFVTPTGIFVSLEYGNEIMTYVQRIKTIKIDLNKIDMINNFSRKFAESDLSIEEGINELKKIDKITGYENTIKILWGSLAAGFFSLLFGANLWDFMASFMVTIFVLIFTTKLCKFNITFFISNFCGAAIASALSILLVKIGLGENVDKIIIGAIMPLVPGVAITNAIRDTMSGDFISGLSRGMEAIVIALSIAFGVGLVLKIYFKGVI